MLEGSMTMASNEIPFSSSRQMGDPERQQPLAGVRVLELGSFVAAPLATRILADFGAEVIKVEPPRRGDELREWGTMVPTRTGKISAWWLAQSRNKRLITLDLHRPEGQMLALRLVEHVDIVIENFRPGRLEQWNLGYERMKAVNPRVVLVRISGFGQTGPYRERAGYGNVGESMGGVRYVTGFPDRPPVRIGVSLGDALAAQQAAYGAILALRASERDGQGQVVDVAITEAVFALTEAMLTEYKHAGVVRERVGNSMLRAAPSNVYQTADGHWLAIGGNGENVFRRLVQALGIPTLVEELAEAQAILDKAGVPAGPVMSIADIAADQHYQARGMLASVPDERMPEGITFMAGIVPRLTETPGAIAHSGGDLGDDNQAVYGNFLGLDPREMELLRTEGII